MVGNLTGLGILKQQTRHDALHTLDPQLNADLSLHFPLGIRHTPPRWQRFSAGRGESLPNLSLKYLNRGVTQQIKSSASEKSYLGTKIQPTQPPPPPDQWLCKLFHIVGRIDMQLNISAAISYIRWDQLGMSFVRKSTATAFTYIFGY